MYTHLATIKTALLQHDTWRRIVSWSSCTERAGFEWTITVCDDATLHLESGDVMLQVNRYAPILAGLENILNHHFQRTKRGSGSGRADGGLQLCRGRCASGQGDVAPEQPQEWRRRSPRLERHGGGGGGGSRPTPTVAFDSITSSSGFGFGGSRRRGTTDTCTMKSHIHEKTESSTMPHRPHVM
jgi:hypothetical protein